MSGENVLVDPNTRQGKRTPVTLKIKFKSETLEQFIERYAVDVSQGGIFIRTKEPLAVGTQMKFEFQLRDASPLIGGEGTVVWTRENDPSRPAIAPGMGVRFDRLADGSQSVLERILSEKAKQSPTRPSEITKPPMFTDTPTRVAPALVQDALLGRNQTPSGRSRPDSFSESSNTPLPRPMPFHSDADDFDERAFEEATKVRSLDELAAQSAVDSEATKTNALPPAPPDDLLDRPNQRRMDSTIADPPPRELPSDPEPARPSAVIDRDSAPGLPSPPVAAPRPIEPSTALLGPTVEPVKTRLGVEPMRAETKQRESVAPPAQVPSIKDAPTRPTGLQGVTSPPPKKEKDRAISAAAASQHMPAARRPSSAPIVIGILVALAAIGAAVWYFVLRPPAEEAVATPKPGSDLGTRPPDIGSNGSAVPQNGSDGSAGSALQANGSDGSAGSAVPQNGSAGSAGSNGSAAAAKVELVDTVIASNIAKSTVEVVGTPQSGPAPFIAKLEKGKPYKVTITASRYATKTVEVKGGDPQVIAKLDAKPLVIHVESDPVGAQVYVDNAATTVKTPGDVTLTTAQAARKTVRVSVRMSGKKPFEQVVDTSSLTDSGDKLTGNVDAGKLAVQVVVQRPVTPPPDKTGSGSAAGSDTTPANGSGATPDKPGSAAPPPPPPPPPTGSGGEPEPDWTKKN